MRANLILWHFHKLMFFCKESSSFSILQWLAKFWLYVDVREDLFCKFSFHSLLTFTSKHSIRFVELLFEVIGCIENDFTKILEHRIIKLNINSITFLKTTTFLIIALCVQLRLKHTDRGIFRKYNLCDCVNIFNTKSIQNSYSIRQFLYNNNINIRIG